MKRRYKMWLVLSLVSLTVHAQRLLIENGNVYIEAFGMNSDVVATPAQLSSKKQTKAEGGRTKYHKGVTAWQNLLISPKFQIAKNDVSTTLQNWYVLNGYSKGGAENNLTDAATGCATYYEASNASDKGTWRVPVMNETLLILLYSDIITDGMVAGFTAPKTGGRYVTSTSYDTDESQFYFMRWGLVTNREPALMGHWYKTDVSLVRCIRDI